VARDVSHLDPALLLCSRGVATVDGVRGCGWSTQHVRRWQQLFAAQDATSLEPPVYLFIYYTNLFRPTYRIKIVTRMTAAVAGARDTRKPEGGFFFLA
jgi:hypothetical protein